MNFELISLVIGEGEQPQHAAYAFEGSTVEDLRSALIQAFDKLIAERGLPAADAPLALGFVVTWEKFEHGEIAIAGHAQNFAATEGAA
jgi:hypothetical protein